MNQSKLSSFVETCISTAIGFAVSYFITLVVLPLYGFEVTHSQTFQMTMIFTVASIIRGYVVRRFFNSLNRSIHE